MVAFTTLIAAAGVAAGIAGTAMQVSGQNKANKAAKRAESIREAQMNLESARQRRDVIRKMNLARAEAVSSAETQGTSSSSGLSGGLASIGAQGGSATLAINQNQQLGAEMFAANRQAASGNSMASFGNGLSSLGGALVNNASTIGKIGTYYSRA